MHDKRFYMTRHGETDMNRARLAAGALDAVLTGDGLAQAEECAALAERLGLAPSVVIHSGLSRTKRTAEIINRRLGRDMVAMPELNEQFYGDWQGVHWDVIHAEMERKGADPPNGESEQDFVARVHGGMSAALAAHPAPALFVLHGGIFIALGLYYGVSIRQIRNCALYEFQPGPGGPFPWRMILHTLENGRPVAAEREIMPLVPPGEENV